VLGATLPVDGALAGHCQLGEALWAPSCGAPFPLLPWLGFPLLALGVGLLVLDGGVDTRSAVRVPWRLLLAGLGALSLCGLLRALGAGASRFGASFSLLKLGCVLLLGAGLGALLGGRRLPRPLLRLSGETLFLYASHLPLLYAGHVGLGALVGHRLSLSAALLAAVGLSLACALGALGYPRLLPALRGRGRAGTPRPQRPSPLG
jgi:hypothetical protein